MIYTNNPLTTGELAGLPSRRPAKAGGYWSEVPHYQLLIELAEAAEAKGYKSGLIEAALNPDQHDLAATIALHPDASFAALLPGMTPALGVMNSNARRFALRVYLGVITDDPVGIPLEVLLVRKHSADAVESAARRLTRAIGPAMRRLPAVVARLRDRRVGSDRARILVTMAGTKRLMPPSRVLRVLDAFLADRDQSYWSLVTAFARVARMNPPVDQLPQVFGFVNLLPK